MNRLYVFYIIEEGVEGKPFAMCDEHKATYTPPSDVIMREIAQHPTIDCNYCLYHNK